MESKKQIAANNGVLAEEKAKQYLIKKGLTFLQQNFKVKVGEIDLIFMEQSQLVFVEVKYRSDNKHGYASEQFTPRKRTKMLRAIYVYLQQQQLNIHHTNLRLDLIAIDYDKLEWIKNI